MIANSSPGSRARTGSLPGTGPAPGSTGGPGTPIAVCGEAREFLREPLRDRADRFVAGELPERLVDLREAVEVDRHDRHLPAAQARLGNRLGAQRKEPVPVGEPGQRIGADQALHVPFDAQVLGHVADHATQHRDPSAGVATGFGLDAHRHPVTADLAQRQFENERYAGAYRMGGRA